MAIARRRRKKQEKINLVPIMDATFIFIFFLLMSVNFSTINEVGSDLPIISNNEPPPDKKPLALTLNIDESGINILTGVPGTLKARIEKNADGEYDLEKLHAFLVSVKKEHTNERSIVLNPMVNIDFEEIVKIMDSVRLLEKTDEAIFNKNKDGISEKVLMLFDQIIFGNTIS